MTGVRVFNGPIEVGLRSLVLLVGAYPHSLDLQRLVSMDYFLVHSGDVVGGPASLHPPSPLRAGEVAIRRGLIEEGLELYRSRGLVEKTMSKDGIQYLADDSSGAFLDALASPYVFDLRDRADWIFDNFGMLETEALAGVLKDSLGRWRAEFAVLTQEGFE